jgi:sugar/nucleoside kinase (ribokinase family)
MVATRFDVLGIGNAIVDVIARTQDDFLIAHKMRKGAMALIDEAGAARIYDAMGPAVEISGGSAANTAVGVAGLRARAAFVGKVKEDDLGRVFAHDIRAAGVSFTTPAAANGPSTGRCYVLVTPDGERTMNTFLGAAQDLYPDDIDQEAIAAASIVYLEGYLWDPPHAKEAFLLIRTGTVDLVFANERELHSLYETADFDTAVNALRNDARVAVVTRSEKGCLVITREETDAISACPVERVVDATGAGDLFAAGFLVGMARGADYRTSARLGALAAAEVIGHLGARPEASLRDLARDAGFDV